jgi:S-DNA-T family DNA segregation ATPase FtsK/SpoIIIE
LYSYALSSRSHTSPAAAATARTRSAGQPPSVVKLQVQRDVLAVVAEVLGDEPRVRTTVVLGRLAELDADAYEPWTHANLARELLAVGVAVRKFDGLKVVRADDVAAALQSSIRDLDETGQ